MRILRILLMAIALPGLIGAEEIVTRFAPGITISYSPPDAKVWKVADRGEQEKIGFIMYMREAILDENGVSGQPVLSIIYRKPPEKVTNIIEFVVYSRMRIPYEITGVTHLKDTVLVLSYKYPVKAISTWSRKLISSKRG